MTADGGRLIRIEGRKVYNNEVNLTRMDLAKFFGREMARWRRSLLLRAVDAPQPGYPLRREMDRVPPFGQAGVSIDVV